MRTRIQPRVIQRKAARPEYPCKVHAGVMWVGQKQARMRFRIIGKEVVTKENFSELQGASDEWGMVELPVGYNPALENQFDPSHAGNYMRDTTQNRT